MTNKNMKKKLEITLEEAIKYYNSSNDKGFKELLEENFGKDFWKPKEIYNEVYDLETLSKKLGYIPLTYISPKNEFEKYLNSCHLLAKVAEIYNEGVKLDWNNINQYKYIPYKYFSNGERWSVDFDCWGMALYCPGRLYYKSENLAKHSYNNFKEYWENIWSH